MSYDESPGIGRFTIEVMQGPGGAVLLERALEELADAAEGLSRAAELVEDDALAAALSEMSELRRNARASIVRTAADAGLDVRYDSDGTLSGVLHRGWMRFGAAVSGDDKVIETVVEEEGDVIEALDAALTRGLPSEIARAVLATREEIRDGRALLSAWQSREKE